MFGGLKNRFDGEERALAEICEVVEPIAEGRDADERDACVLVLAVVRGDGEMCVRAVLADLHFEVFHQSSDYFC